MVSMMANSHILRSLFYGFVSILALILNDNLFIICISHCLLMMFGLKVRTDFAAFILRLVWILDLWNRGISSFLRSGHLRHLS